MELRVNEIQIPESITFNYEELKNKVQEKVSTYTTLVYTDAQIKEAKADKADLNRLKKALNDEKIRREREYMQPFNDFKTKINEIIGIIDEPVKLIDKQVKEYEQIKRDEKQEKIMELFVEADFPDWIALERVQDAKWLNATVTLKSIKESLLERKEQIQKDLEMLRILPEFSFEAEQVYMTTLDVQKSVNKAHEMAEIQKRKKQTEEEKARLKAEREKVKGLDGSVYVQDADKQGFTANDPEQLPGQYGFTDAESFEQYMNPPVERTWLSFRANLTVEDAQALANLFAVRGIEYEQI